ncbi:MAG TPA: hypothetical protein VGL59_00245 [Polyangia bacterium]|jgi:hypothetical protein
MKRAPSVTPPNATTLSNQDEIMKKFSQRMGYTPVRDVLQTTEVTPDLRNTLWNVVLTYMRERQYFSEGPWGMSPAISAFAYTLWHDHLKLPVDEIPSADGISRVLKDTILKGTWLQVYDLLEAIVTVLSDRHLDDSLNEVLERELAGYRLVGRQFVAITQEVEVSAIETALAEPKASGATKHLRTALILLSDRTAPDYRNSIKESISAVESAARILTDDEKATLGQALNLLESSGQIHKALQKGFSALYGYTNDSQGIRHAMLEEPTLTAADAKFFLISCSAFVSYLISRLPPQKAG